MYPTAFDSPLEWNGLFGTSSSNWFSCISIGIAEHGMFIEWKNKKRVKNNFHVYFIRRLQKLNSHDRFLRAVDKKVLAEGLDGLNYVQDILQIAYLQVSSKSRCGILVSCNPLI